MIFNEIKCPVNTSLGLVGDASPASPPVSAPAGFIISLEVDEKFFVESQMLMPVNWQKRYFTQTLSTQSCFPHYLHNSMAS